MKKHIFVLYTGGTIGMSAGSKGLVPDAALAGKALAPFAARCDFDWHICNSLIDSSAVTLKNWQDWLTVLQDKIPQYDGVLVLHGTDTLAYTANIFALALKGLNKPVVLTGSQWPYDSEHSDAPLNLATAVAALELPDMKDVVLAFNGKLFPAVGSSKISTESADGFDNAHFGVLGVWHEEAGWGRLCLSEKTAEPFVVQAIDVQANVECYTLIPGVMADTAARNIAGNAADAVILQTYGHGNVPDNRALIEAVRHVTQQGKLVLNISQVPQGCAAAVYAQGSALREAGAVSGGKCNLETAVALLTLAAGKRADIQWLESELQRLGLR
ncbi:asparaginase [Neisseria canis]|uniref:L-asparaginase n=1 Tax=Neisseria canis TaxID=493 RepID=A0A1X3D0N9_9NEIS|nr:asparaginase [Neisseria canis]OSI13271.1 L-asparaginase [Neisseria canis]VEF01772.1 L-asparaginase [Neisseria canis]